jgi:hypothetical protein
VARVDWAVSRERAATTLESYSDPGAPSRQFLDAAATRHGSSSDMVPIKVFVEN